MLESSPQFRPAALRDLWAGLALVPRAFVLTLRQPRVLVLALLCAAVTAVCLVGSAMLLWAPARELGEGWVGGGAGWRDALGIWVGLLVYLAILAVTWLTLPAVLLAPLQDPLSEAVEEALGNFQKSAFSASQAVRGVGIALSHTALRLTLQLAGYVVLFPLNFIPVAGSVLWAAVSALWTMWWLAAEYLSGPMARHLYPFGQVLRGMRRRPALALGFGAALHLLLFVPVVNFFLVPLAVVGATIFFRTLAAQGNIER